jgi:dihydropteroate synthase
MQHDPRYRFAPLDVLDALEARIAAARDHGIAAGNIAVDPGIGFGKRVTHNVALLARAGLLHGLGVAVLAGVSRKGFVGRIAGGAPADARLPGSLAAGLAAAGQGVQILRVHDVAETRQALDMLRAITFGIHPD